MDEFYEYFNKLSNDITVLANDEADQLYSSHDFSGDDATFPELDQPIPVSEITEAVKTLKTCKATSNDYLLNEYFIDGIDILSSHLCDLFNSILNSGYFPDQWSEGIIVPVYKKGDVSNIENNIHKHIQWIKHIHDYEWENAYCMYK